MDISFDPRVVVTTRVFAVLTSAGILVGASTGAVFLPVLGLFAGPIIGLPFGLLSAIITAITVGTVAGFDEPLTAAYARRLFRAPSLILMALIVLVIVVGGGPGGLLPAAAVLVIGVPQFGLMLHALAPWCLTPVVPGFRRSLRRKTVTAALLMPITIGCLVTAAWFWWL